MTGATRIKKHLSELGLVSVLALIPDLNLVFICRIIWTFFLSLDLGVCVFPLLQPVRASAPSRTSFRTTTRTNGVHLCAELTRAPYTPVPESQPCPGRTRREGIAAEPHPTVESVNEVLRNTAAHPGSEWPTGRDASRPVYQSTDWFVASTQPLAAGESLTWTSVYGARERPLFWLPSCGSLCSHKSHRSSSAGSRGEDPKRSVSFRRCCSHLLIKTELRFGGIQPPGPWF